MTRKEALQELLAKVEAGETMNYRDPLDLVRAWRSPLEYFNITDLVTQSHNGSLDAAKALHEAVLGDGYVSKGYKWCMWGSGQVSVWNVITGAHEVGQVQDPHLHNVSPARAWLIAIIKALIAKEPT